MTDFMEENPDNLTPCMPHSREAEEAVVGSVFINPDIFNDLSLIVSPPDFYIHRNGWIWEAFIRLNERNSPIDMLTLSDELERINQLAEIGGPAYLTSLVNQVPSSLNAESYAHIVRDRAIRRNGIEKANRIANAAYNLEAAFDPSLIWSSMLDGNGKGSTRKEADDIIGGLYTDLYESKLPFSFGIPDLDSRLGGMFRSELTTLAGDSGTGKSAMMIWMAKKNVEVGNSCLVVSLEMQAKTLYARMACGELGVGWNAVRAGKVADNIKSQVWSKVQELHERLNGNLIIYEDPMTLSSIQAACAKEHADIVFVDHVNLISGMKETRNTIEQIEQLNRTARFLRQNIAKPMNCAVVLLWQLTRSAFKENRRPTKHDLYLAGVQDPDSILLLYRPDLYSEEMQLNPTGQPVDLEVIIGKARNDATGIVPLKYNLQKQSFYGVKL